MSRVRVARALPAGPVPVREPTLDDRIDGWLRDWHDYRATYRLGKGHRATASSGADSYSTPTHHDWWNGAHEEQRDRARDRALDDAMEAVRLVNRQWFLGLQAQARCYATGVCVYLVPGLPRELPELDVLLQEARNRFARECIARKIDT